MQEVDQQLDVTHEQFVDVLADPLALTISTLTTLSQQYWLLMRAENRLDKQRGAIERGIKVTLGYKATEVVELKDSDFLPSYWIIKAHFESMRKERLAWKKYIEREAVKLPVWPWVEAIPGIGAHLLGMIIGETGDLSNYANPAKVWKRMGLAVELDGRAQRRIKGTNTLEKIKAVDAGYSPRRRTVMYLAGAAMEMLNKHGKDNPAEYRQLYLAKKAEYVARETGCGRKKCTKEKCTPGHIRSMALRVMEKRFLKDLWCTWRDWKKSLEV